MAAVDELLALTRDLYAQQQVPIFKYVRDLIKQALHGYQVNL